MATYTSTTYSWITVSPSTGTGSTAGESVNVTSSAYTGRSPRTGSVKLSASTGSKVVTVTQSRPQFISGLTVNRTSIPNSGGTFTVSGVSNCPGLIFGVTSDGRISGGDIIRLTTPYSATTPTLDVESAYTVFDSITIAQTAVNNAKSYLWTATTIGEDVAYKFRTSFTVVRNTDQVALPIALRIEGQSGSTTGTAETGITAVKSLSQLPSEIIVTPSGLTASSTKTTFNGVVKSSSAWTATTSASWISGGTAISGTGSTDGESTVFKILYNGGRSTRKANITFNNGTYITDVPITQSGRTEFISLSSASTITAATTSITSGVSSYTISGMSNCEGLLFYFDQPYAYPTGHRSGSRRANLSAQTSGGSVVAYSGLCLASGTSVYYPEVQVWSNNEGTDNVYFYMIAITSKANSTGASRTFNLHICKATAENISQSGNTPTATLTITQAG